MSKKSVLGLVALLSLVFSISTASAQGVWSYSVKFVCGAAETDPREMPIVEPGFYATEINIHNFGREGTEVRKQVIFLVQDNEAVGREPNVVGPSADDGIGLPPNTATMDDCLRIREIAGVDTSVLTIGYLVLQSSQPLNVDAVYTTTGREPGASAPSIEVERVEGNQI